MKVGYLVKVKDGSYISPGIIVEIDEPLVHQPFQIALVQFNNGKQLRFVTTTLKVISEVAANET